MPKIWALFNDSLLIFKDKENQKQLYNISKWE